MWVQMTAENMNEVPIKGDVPSRRPWVQGLAALAVTAAVLALATLAGTVAGMVFDRWSGLNGGARSWLAGEREALVTAHLAVFLLTFQVVTVALTIAASSRFVREGEELLPLELPRGGALTVIAAALALLGLAGIGATAEYVLDRSTLVSDVQPFVEIMKARTWWLMLIAAAAGAPLSEEVLFRGFLYGVLRTSIAGRIGAALVTAFVWACLHANYSLYGMSAIFVIGLYLAWVREKSGSLLTPMVCHGLYNGLIVVALSSAPDTLFQP